MTISHGRTISEDQAVFERLSLQPDESAGGRGIEGSHLQRFSAVALHHPGAKRRQRRS